MDDLISRQSVIAVLDKTKRIAINNLDGEVLKAFCSTLNSLTNIVDSLPSAQPGIIRCKDCLYQKMCLWKMQGADFCSYAERREVTNGN
jgi:CRISPR/Cas system-associated exonuclease Cas4 (RecB family)